MLKVGEGITTICNADSVAENGTLAVLAMPALQLGARRVVQTKSAINNVQSKRHRILLT